MARTRGRRAQPGREQVCGWTAPPTQHAYMQCVCACVTKAPAALCSCLHKQEPSQVQTTATFIISFSLRYIGSPGAF